MNDQREPKNNAETNAGALGAASLVRLEAPTAAELVTCSLRYPDYVCHLPHAECVVQEPHHIDSCGRFLPKRDALPVPATGPSLRALLAETERQEDV
jgi:hypothetical protein